MAVPHYLLRAAPDGEGDWFFRGTPKTVRLLRADKKHPFSEAFTLQMIRIIQQRHLPILVDMGGKPRGAQFGILNACTHAILLYRQEADRRQWHEWLTAHNVQIIAELQSRQETEESLVSARPYLRGIISGLERDPALQRTGPVFGALLNVVSQIFAYDAEELRQQHLRQAPYPPLEERQLARCDGVTPQAPHHWQPADLKALAACFPQYAAYAFYGRGPAWLSAFVAAQTAPAPLALFDARYGWLPLPALRFRPPYTLQMTRHPAGEQAHWLGYRIVGGLLEPDHLALPPLSTPVAGGLVLSGPLPKWAFAALTRHYQSQADWLALYDPALGAAVVVHGSPPHAPGDLLPLTPPVS